MLIPSDGVIAVVRMCELEFSPGSERGAPLTSAQALHNLIRDPNFVKIYVVDNYESKLL